MALILTRRINEKLIIDGDIKIEILGVKGNQVRLGIEAPKEITVHREEIQLKLTKSDGTGFLPRTVRTPVSNTLSTSH